MTSIVILLIHDYVASTYISHPPFPFENQMLKHQLSELRRLNLSNQNNHEELEQYGRHLCVPTKTSESSDDVLDSVKSLS